MDINSPMELVSVGAKIVEVGSKLADLQAQRLVLNDLIATLEADLRPLVVRHSQLVAELGGTLKTSQPEPTKIAVTRQVNGAGSLTSRARDVVRRRVLQFMQTYTGEENLTASFIASELDEDAMLVRDVMRGTDTIDSRLPPVPTEAEESPAVLEDGDDEDE